MSQGVTILLCNCSNAKVIPAQTKEEVKEKLNARGAEFIEMDDLCALAAERNPSLKRIADSEKLYIAACYPRAVRWLFHAAGAPLNESRTEFLNMRKLTGEEVIQKIREDVSRPTEKPLSLTVEKENWEPWFPVIDFDRCSNCKQCLSFCLFGVFGIDEYGTIEVRNPHKCKNECPACSRVCPEVAIIFPKYGRAPINGSEVSESDTQQEPVKVDMSAMVSRGIHASLRERSQGTKKRFFRTQETGRYGRSLRMPPYPQGETGDS